MEKLKKILVEQGVKLKLEKKFNRNAITVRRALKGETSTKLAMLIRASALHEFNGALVGDSKVIIK